MTKPQKTAREAALAALIELRTRGAWPDRMLRSSLGGLSADDAGLATAIAYGVLQQRGLLDFYISSFSSVKLGRIMPQVLDALRMGAYQLLFMDKIPVYAAINESVTHARAYGGARAGGFANAVLRTIDRERGSLPEPDKSDLVRYLSVKYSHPLPLVERFLKIFGERQCQSLLAANNAATRHAARVNTLRTNASALLERLEDGCARPHEYLPDALVFESLRGMHTDAAMADGSYHLMDTASQLCVLALDPQPGCELVDMCAAPGGKTLMAAQLMRGSGRIIATDIHASKVEQLARRAVTCGVADIVSVKVADASVFDKSLENSADYIICDVPCSGYGIIRKKPDIRYKDLGKAAELPALQINIAQNAARYLRPGGVMVYSTCTVLPEENERVVERLLSAQAVLALEPFELPGIGTAESGMLTLLPHIHDTDGFFIARLRKN